MQECKNKEKNREKNKERTKKDKTALLSDE